MRFRLNAAINDEEYIDFNKFNLLRSPYGRSYMIKNVILVDICLGVVAIGFLLTALLFDSFALLAAFLLFAAAAGAYPFVLPKLLIIKMEKQIRPLLASGEPVYTREQAIEFHDDILISDNGKEINKVEYANIDRICISDGHIYVFTKIKIAYIIKISDFDSREEYSRFLDFIEDRFERVEFYLANRKKPFSHPKKIRVITGDCDENSSCKDTKKEIEDLNILPSRSADAPLMEKVERS